MDLDFLARTPYGHAQDDVLDAELRAAGFAAVEITHVDGTCHTNARDAAISVCKGTPLRGEIERHPSMTLDRACELAETAFRERCGSGSFDAPMRWVEIIAR